MLTLVFIIIAVMITKHHAQTDPGDNVTPMELEFKNLANVKAEPSRFVSANLQVVSMNIAKNDDDGDQTWILSNVLDQ